MEYSPDEITSMAICLCATFHGLDYKRSGAHHGEIGENWIRVAEVAFSHFDDIKNNRETAMLDTKMGPEMIITKYALLVLTCSCGAVAIFGAITMGRLLIRTVWGT